MPDDAIGLQVGTLNKEIRKVLVTLEVTEEVVEEAAREKADLIIAHHAVIFVRSAIFARTPRRGKYTKSASSTISRCMWPIRIWMWRRTASMT